MFNRKRYLVRDLPTRLEIPKPRNALRNFPWLHNDKLAQRYIVHEAELLQYDQGAVIIDEDDYYKVREGLCACFSTIFHVCWFTHLSVHLCADCSFLGGWGAFQFSVFNYFPSLNLSND